MSYENNEIKNINRLIPLVSAEQFMRDILNYDFTTFSLVRSSTDELTTFFWEKKSMDELKKSYVKQALEKFKEHTK
jgi:hypothetical protein